MFVYKEWQIEDAGDILTDAMPPLLHIAIVDAAQVQPLIEILTQKDEGLAVTTISGTRARTEADFFAQVARKLSFPEYFGNNWNSFDECITDVRRNRASGYVWLVTEPDLLLISETAESLGRLVGTLEDAAETWREQSRGDGESDVPTPFNVLFACSASAIEPFIRRLKQAEVDLPPAASSLK